MKNILIIRSANYNIIDILIDYIYINNKKEDVNLYFLTQSSSIEIISKRAPEAIILKLPPGNINYKTLKKENKLFKIINEVKYNEIYIPSSYEDFEEFDEVKLIASKLYCEKVFLFNKYGKILNVKLSYSKIYFLYKILAPFKKKFSSIAKGIIYILAILYHLIRYHILRKEI